MTTKYITLTAVDKRVSIPAYCAAIRLAKANPDREFKYGLTTWWPTTGRDIMRQFLAGVHDRINRHAT